MFVLHVDTFKAGVRTQISRGQKTLKSLLQRFMQNLFDIAQAAQALAVR